MKSIKGKYIMVLVALLLAVLLNKYPSMIEEDDVQIKICEEDGKIEEVEKTNIDEKGKA